MPNFNRKIFVDGKFACDTTAQSAPLYEKAYQSQFPKSSIETFTPTEIKAAQEARRNIAEGMARLGVNA